MVCSHCNGLCINKHNKRTCPYLRDIATPAEKRIAKDLGEMLDYPVVIKHNRGAKPLEGLACCMNIFKEPKAIKLKKISKPLEGLAGCMNIFKEPKTFYTAKKTRKPLEGLAGCQNIFKEPKVLCSPKRNTTCGSCGEKGHNKRSCTLICRPCVDQTTRAICFAGLTAEKAVKLAQTLEAVNPFD